MTVDSIVQHSTKLLDRIKSHIITSDEEQYVGKEVVKKPKRYFKKRKAVHPIENNEIKHRPLFQKRKCQKQQRQNAKDIHASLLSIKQQMSEFKVPADWCCTKENRIDDLEPFLPSQMIRDVIKNINMHRLAIEAAMKRIELKQCEIRQFSEGLSKLDHKLEHLIIRPDGNKKIIESIAQVKKNKSLLKQTYIRHRRIRRTIDANKSILNSTVSLKRLREKVDEFNNHASFWSMMHWLFPLVLAVFLLHLLLQ